MKSTRPRRQNRNASVTLEFILILPFLVVTLLAMVQFSVALIVRQAVTHAATVAAREAGKYEDIQEVARVVDAVLQSAHGIDVATVTVPGGTPPLEDEVTAVVDSGVRIVLEVGQPDAAGRNATPYDFGDTNVTCNPPAAPTLQSDEVRVTVCIDLGRRPMCSWLYSFSPDYVNFSNRCFSVSALVKKE
ncbi:MAG: pilus assembly protein [Candidatus Anammoximicrobium sp.]|nr:pilus assembly protein [Candidatus Anammoximicrobium sp.]